MDTTGTLASFHRNHADVGVSNTPPGNSNTCKPKALRSVPLFALLDNDETAVLASQVEVKTFNARERIYKMGDSSVQAYVMVSGKVRLTTIGDVANMLRSWRELPLHSQTAGLAERSHDQLVANLERSHTADSEAFTVFGQT